MKTGLLAEWSLPGFLALGWLSLAAWSEARAAAPASEKTYEVEVKADIPYYQGKDAHNIKHKLDLYLPSGKKNFPVLFFVHGGAWRIGDKGQFGLYSSIGKCFAGQGVGTVIPNYRLSPKVVHPAHIQDVARSFAWTFKNIKKYGGNPEAIFLGGHSAGGHLVSLLATDDTYLKAQGLTLKAIKGVMPVSGIFKIPNRAVFDPMFGKDVEVRKKASPITHARADAPPFLIIYASNDFPECDKPAVLAFCNALKKKKCPAETLEVNYRNHMTILFLLRFSGDPATKAMMAFINKKLSPEKRAQVTR
jgi:acetyl esterase/lipase